MHIRNIRKLAPYKISRYTVVAQLALNTMEWQYIVCTAYMQGLILSVFMRCEFHSLQKVVDDLV